MLRFAGVAMISAYQRYLSPKKGFRCAYGALHGAGTCSSIGKRIMRERGFFAFLNLMPEQFAACKLAAQNLNQETEEERKRRRRKRFSDIDCSTCDVPDCGDISDCDDSLDCGSCDSSD
jgi:putative component of membrane protein insertase Oxa1/YidC/SpoIIIJ protein YidD